MVDMLWTVCSDEGLTLKTSAKPNLSGEKQTISIFVDQNPFLHYVLC